MEDLASVVGNNLASLRKKKGLTQQQLAEQIHYSDKSISKWELGYSVPSVDILMEFASFYGVSVDYLIHAQTEEDLAKVASHEIDEMPPINKALILAMSLTFVVLVAMSIFFSGYFFRPGEELAWPVFLWMVPVAIFVAMVECAHFYHIKRLNVILRSIFVWVFITCFAVHFQFFNKPGENIWFIEIVCIPIQVIIILMGKYKRRARITFTQSDK